MNSSALFIFVDHCGGTAAIEELSASIGEIVDRVTQASQEAGAASDQVNAKVGDLNEQSALLKTQVDKFVAQVRAA